MLSINTKRMKNLLKSIAIIATFAIAGSAMAATWGTDFPTVEATDKDFSNANWQGTVTVNEGDMISFDIFYYVRGSQATNVHAKLENISGKSFKAGESVTVDAFTTGDGLSKRTGSVTLKFADDVTMDFYGTNHQKMQCDSLLCGTDVSGTAVLSSQGYKVGTVPANEWGNVIVGFKAKGYNAPTNYDDCKLDGVTVKHGKTYRFYSESSTYGQCSAYDQVRTCNDGVLSGSDSYKYATCKEKDNDADDIDVDTRSATDIDEDSARLNGEMNGDDDIDVWFAFDENDSTPSCSNSSQRVGFDTVDDGDKFSHKVYGLDEDETYYYRACARDADDKIVSGDRERFTTEEEDDDNNNDDDVEIRAITNVASSIGTNSARLNGIVTGEGDATCYFQYGRTTTFGLTSAGVAIDLDRETTCSSFRTGLASNSLYYYRLVVRHDGDYYYGATRAFRTDAVATNNNPTVTNTNTTVTIVNNEVAEELDVTKWVSAETDPRFDVYTQAMPGETVYYKVRVENNTDEDLENIVVIDRIPFYLELDEDRGTDDDDDKQVRWVINLDRGESRTFITQMRVREDARFGDVIVSYASAEADDYSANSNDVEIEIDNGDAFVDDDEVIGGQAGFLFGASIFPNTLIGWLLLILLILAIAYMISRIIAARNENARVLAELQAAKAARDNA